MGSRRGALPLLVAFMVLLNSCGGPTETATTGPTGTSASGAPSGQLVVAAISTPDSLDELGGTLASFQTVFGLYERLLEYRYTFNEDGIGIPDTSGNFEPKLAESWSFSDDGLTLTFELRQGVLSEFGNELTAEDVVWSFQRTYAIQGNGIGKFALGKVTGPEGIVATGEYTVELQLSQPSQLFLHNETYDCCAMILDTTEVKKHATAEDPWAKDWLATHSATFGPYRVTEYSPGTQVVLEFNPNYYGDPPQIAKIIYREVPEGATRLQLLLSGDVDIAEDLDSRQRLELEGQSGVKTIDYSGNDGAILGLSFNYEPFRDVRVRQAIAYAAPVDAIIETVYNNDPTVRLLTGYISEDYPSHVDYWPYSTDLDKARELLAEAGQGPFQMEITFNAARREHEQIAVLMQSQLKEIGIDVIIDGLQPAQYQEKWHGASAQAILVQDAAWNADPGYGLQLYFGRGEESPAHWTNYDDDRVQDMIEQVDATIDPAERIELGKETYEALVDTAPWAFVIGTGFHIAVRDNVAGVYWRTSNLLTFHNLYFTD